MIKKNSYEKSDLLKSGEGLLMGPNTGKLPLEPMLIVKMNRKKPLCIIDLDHFFNLQKK